MTKVFRTKEILTEYINRLSAANQERLPAERILADELGFSRATIGKALGVLEGEGLVVRKKGSGTYIADNGKKKRMTIALAMRRAYHCTDPHFRLIVNEVSRFAEQNNMYVQIYDRLPDMFKEDPEDNNLMDAIRSGRVNGVLITSRMPLSIISRINAACPVVSINNIFGDGNEVPCISCDYFYAGFLAGKYLLDKGHRKIAYVTENINHPESAFDFSGLRAAGEMAGVKITQDDVLDTKIYMHIFNKRIGKFFKGTDYTACFVRSTTYAARMIAALNQYNIKVPDDLSIIAGGNYCNASGELKLSVIDNQLNEMCRCGLGLLCDLISGKNSNGTPGIKLLSPKLIENGSCRNINK